MASTWRLMRTPLPQRQPLRTGQAPGMALSLNNQPVRRAADHDSYLILMYSSPRMQRSQRSVAFFDWAFKSGGSWPTSWTTWPCHRQRLTTFGSLSGHRLKTNPTAPALQGFCHDVLFVYHNSARSILAEALLNHLGAPLVKAYSAGSSPRENQCSPNGLAALEKRGIATADLLSKSWDVLPRLTRPNGCHHHSMRQRGGEVALSGRGIPSLFTGAILTPLLVTRPRLLSSSF